MTTQMDAPPVAPSPPTTASIPPWLVQAIAARLRDGSPVDHERAAALLQAIDQAKKRGLHVIPPQNFVDPDPVRWIETHFRIPETPDHRLNLSPYQRLALTQALSRNPAGNFNYSNVIWSDIKKSAKSTIAAAVALWMGFQNPWGQVILVANDLKQADSRVGFYLRRAIELNPDLAAVCKSSATSYRVTLPNHTIIEAVPIDPTGEAGSNADFIVFSELWGAHQDAQSRMWCLDDQTEVLTPSGWKPGVELTGAEQIAVYDQGQVHWEYPREVFCAPFSGTLHTYQHKNFSLFCTEDHRLYGRYSMHGRKNGTDSYEYTGIMRSNALRASHYRYYHPTMIVDNVDPLSPPPAFIQLPATKHKPAKRISWGDWVEFLGLYLTEGSTSCFRGKPVKVRVSQLRPPHPARYQEIQTILEHTFGDWVKIDQRDGFRIHSSSLATLLAPLGKTFDKRIPREVLNSNQADLERFLHAYILGDGHLQKNGRVQITCASKGMADDLQEVTLRLGRRCSIRPSGKYWRVKIMPPDENCVSIDQKHWKEIPYIGKVWCPSVSTGLFVARRDGRVFITGNTEMTLSPTKFGKSLRWVETYAGYTGESVLLERLWTEYVKPFYDERGYHPSFDWARSMTPPLPIFASTPQRTLVLWNDHPRLPWQSHEYYAQEEGVLLPGEFLRIHRNQWVSSQESFVPAEWWDACRVDALPALTRNDSLIVCADAGVSSDSFAVIGVSRLELPMPPDADPLTYEDNSLYDVRYVGVWYPPPGGKIDFALPEAELRRLFREHNVVEFCYDPYQLEDMAGRFRNEAVVTTYAFSQGVDRLIADKALYDNIRQRRIRHTGEPDLREHVLNANAEKGKDGKSLRLVKKSESRKIDATVALSMARDRASYWKI